MTWPRAVANSTCTRQQVASEAWIAPWKCSPAGYAQPLVPPKRSSSTALCSAASNGVGRDGESPRQPCVKPPSPTVACLMRYDPMRRSRRQSSPKRTSSNLTANPSAFGHWASSPIIGATGESIVKMRTILHVAPSTDAWVRKRLSTLDTRSDRVLPSTTQALASSATPRLTTETTVGSPVGAYSKQTYDDVMAFRVGAALERELPWGPWDAEHLPALAASAST